MVLGPRRRGSRGRRLRRSREFALVEYVVVHLVVHLDDQSAKRGELLRLVLNGGEFVAEFGLETAAEVRNLHGLCHVEEGEVVFELRSVSVCGAGLTECADLAHRVGDKVDVLEAFDERLLESVVVVEDAGLLAVQQVVPMDGLSVAQVPREVNDLIVVERKVASEEVERTAHVAEERDDLLGLPVEDAWLAELDATTSGGWGGGSRLFGMGAVCSCERIVATSCVSA